MSVATFLIQGQQNTKYLLAHFVVDEYGWLTDANEIGFAIDDETGAQVFPPSGWEDVATGDGRVDRGYYYAWDEGSGSPWAVPALANAGQWRIRWRWKVSASDTYSTWTMPFQVEESSIGFQFDYRTLISPTQIRDEGITTTTLPDSRMAMLIELSTQLLEVRCGQHFRPIYVSQRRNGHWSEAMFFQVPIIGLAEVRVNGSDTALNKSSLNISNARIDQEIQYNPSPDPRRNPNIRFKQEASIFSGVGVNRRVPRFGTGAGQQYVKGVFGFLETNGAVPALITHAMKRLVYNNSIRMRPTATVASGPLIAETVDRHTRMWATGGKASTAHVLATSKEVEEIIAQYRRPIGLGTTAPVWPLPLDSAQFA